MITDAVTAKAEIDAVEAATSWVSAKGECLPARPLVARLETVRSWITANPLPEAEALCDQIQAVTTKILLRLGIDVSTPEKLRRCLIAWGRITP